MLSWRHGKAVRFEPGSEVRDTYVASASDSLSAAINGQFQAVYGSRNLRGDQKPRTLAFLYGKRDTQYWGTTWAASS
jgi:hypothetical protein